jgi:hypothetical protein
MQAPTRSKRTWSILMQKYIDVHNKDSKYITIEKAHADLVELYNELLMSIDNARDSIILECIYKLIRQYNREVNNKLLSYNKILL